VVEDGSSALALARTEQFDLIVLDLGLPTRDGLSVLEELRREGTGCRWSSSRLEPSWRTR
jgi:DNA-binding response OmpR family regulator